MSSNNPTGNNPYQNAIHNALQGMQTVTPPNHLSSLYPDSDSEDGDETSAIRICIETPLNIRGDNNLVAVDPSEIAKQVALSMVSALSSLCEGGSIPMIDENGTPRPIKFEIKAEVNVEGSRNVVGEAAVLEAVVDAKVPKLKVTEEGLANAKVGTRVDENGNPKAGEATFGTKEKVAGEERNGVDKSMENAQANGNANGQVNGHVDGHELKESRKRELSPNPANDGFDDDDAVLPAANAKRARKQ